MASPAAAYLDLWSSQQIITCHDESVGLKAIIVIDDTTLGPALGGVRCRLYDSTRDALLEAQRLAASMTLKHALAELPYGGGKAVVLGSREPQTPQERAALMVRLGEFVAQLGGHYIPGVEMGTAHTDLLAVRAGGALVLGADSDPSPWTARGVFAAMRAAVLHRFGTASLEGLTVSVQGAGAVGSVLARFIAADGGTVLIADIDVARADRVAEEVGGRPIDVVDAPYARCDVFAPCAAARTLTPEVVARLQCSVVAGSANDALEDGAEEALAQRGITYVPDIVAGAGGAIHEHARSLNWDDAQLSASVDAIGPRVLKLVAEADELGLTPLELALRQAAARIAAGR
ncbi:Glu/Leu/Phe/Val dehydrogenase family protein [Gephyromycinifex aptenodytis]|uniref:Glu/Leu/Phe/Val dehydrogenase family protein n=1 Tax=Gephyromycinifex aptenodytis TaxID=2716227 RepID=UPI001444AA78|nr:Glu/Leu/Phe/Val dehydrogenase [Gephyromycinifex aptenodytis]